MKATQSPRVRSRMLADLIETGIRSGMTQAGADEHARRVLEEYGRRVCARGILRDDDALAWLDLFHGDTAEMHELKCDPEPFKAVRDGKKRYELRVNDRGFMIGDVLHLREHDRQTYCGGEILCVVTYMTPAGRYGLPDDLVCLSIDHVTEVCLPAGSEVLRGE